MDATLRALLFIIIFGFVNGDREPGMRSNVPMGKFQQLIDSMFIFKQDLFAPSTVKAFYEQRDYQAAWLQADHQNIEDLLGTIRNAHFYGLISREYHLPIVDSLRTHSEPNNLLLLDIMLTDAFFKLAHNLNNGRLSNGNYASRQKLIQTDRVLVSLLQTALTTKTVKTSLEKTEPLQTDYHDLKDRLRQRLTEYGANLSNSERKKFLLAEILKLTINLERWRWEDPSPSRYLLVNIPSYTFKLIEKDSVLLVSKVIVGQPDKPTPILTSNIECLVLYPYWHVPRSIATKELLPQLKQDPSYLEKNNFEVLDTKGKRILSDTINWKQYSETHFPFRLRQREGPDNALGIIKFQFENPYGVYLHDTNAKELFSRHVRALSHGCIRSEKAIELAEFILAYDSGIINSSGLRPILTLQTRMEITLKKRLPILVRYFTADGDRTYPDIYSRDFDLKKSYEPFLQELQKQEFNEALNQQHSLATVD